jgi:hypothetical protein
MKGNMGLNFTDTHRQLAEELAQIATGIHKMIVNPEVSTEECLRQLDILSKHPVTDAEDAAILQTFITGLEGSLECRQPNHMGRTE